MDNNLIVLGIGGLVLATGLIGKLELKWLKIGTLNPVARVLEFIIGTALILFSIYHPADRLITDKETEISELKASILNFTQERDAAQSERDAAQSERDTAQTERDMAQSDIKAIQSEIAKLREDPKLKSIANRLAAKSKEADRYRKKLNSSLTKINNLESRTKGVNIPSPSKNGRPADIAELKKQLASKNEELSRLKKEISQIPPKKEIPPQKPQIKAQEIKPGIDLRNADLSGTNLSKTNLSEADLREANLSKADLGEATLWKAKLHGADIEGTSLREANLGRADLSKAKLGEANLRNATLERAILHGADLWRAKLYGTDLKETNLREANLNGADFRAAFLKNADLSGADLRDAKNLTIEQLRGVKSLYKTKLDPVLMDQVSKQYSHLLKKPEDLK